MADGILTLNAMMPERDPTGEKILEPGLGAGIGLAVASYLKSKNKENLPVETKLPKKEPPEDPDFIPEVLELFNQDEDEGMKYNEKLGRKIMDMEHYTNKMPENYDGPTVETVTSGYDAHPFTKKDFSGGALDNKTIKKAFLYVAGDEGETEVEIQPFNRDNFLLTPERGQKEIALRLIKQKLIEDKADPKIITHITNIQKILNDEIKKLGYLGAGAELEENLNIGFGLFDQLKRKKHATGGIAGMLGEPRSGYQGGGAASTNALIRTLYDTAGGFEGTGKTFSEFMDDILFRGDYLNRAQGGRIGLEGGGITDVIETGPTRQQLIIKWLNDRGLPITPENIQKAIMEMSQGGQAPVVTGRQQIEAPPMEMPSPPTGEGYVPEELIGQDISETVTPAVADIIPRSKPDDDVFSDEEMRAMKQRYIEQGGTLDKASWGIEDDVEDAGIMQTRDPIFYSEDETIYTDDDKKEWFDQINRFKTYRRGLAPDSYLRLKDDKMKEGINKGFISEEDYLNKWQMPFFGRRGERKTKEIDRYRNWAFGDDNYAQGGRIGLADGDTPSEAYLRDIFFSIPEGDQLGSMSFQEWKNSPSGQHYKDKWISEHRPKLNDGGPVSDEEKYELYKQEKEGEGEEYMDFDLWKQFQLFDWGKAEGGRIGFAEGEGIMSRVGDMVDVRNVPYYSGKALQGLVNSAETLSKFPLAAGKLGSQLIQKPPKKEMFMDAIENITPGSWSENLGLTELVEGMGEKRPKDAQTVGGILGLGTEVAVPTGGAFKAGQLLLSKASKAMGKIKDGKTLEKLVDEKLTDAGQSRRDFNIMAATGSLVGALKWLGLGGILKTTVKLKPSEDVVMRLRTFIDDSDVDTEWGPVAQGQWGGAFDVEGLTKAAQKTLVGIMKDVKAFRNKGSGSELPSKNLVDSYDDILPEDSSYILEALQKAGHKVRYEHVPEMGGWSVNDILSKFKNDPMYKGTKEGAEKYKKFKEKTDKWSARKKDEYHTDITDNWGRHHNPDVEDFYDTFYGVEKPKRETIVDFLKYPRKAEGGRIGLGAGGPPISRGNLTKTIPPSKGPVPQGLPSALYNGIMRPRSY